LPANLTQQMKRKIQTLIDKIVNVFQLKNCAIKLDLVIKDNIVYVLECAPRLGGGKLSSTMIPMAYGIEWWTLAVKIAMGMPINEAEIRPLFQKAVVQRYKFPEGEVKSNRDRLYSVECAGDSFEEALNKLKEALK
jgi:biotin carboxylase